MASTGQGSTHAPQSMHSSGSMKYCSDASSEWMQSTGQTSTQEASLSPIHGWVMVYATAGISLADQIQLHQTGARACSISPVAHCGGGHAESTSRSPQICPAHSTPSPLDAQSSAGDVRCCHLWLRPPWWPTDPAGASTFRSL